MCVCMCVFACVCVCVCLPLTSRDNQCWDHTCILSAGFGGGGVSWQVSAGKPLVKDLYCRAPTSSGSALCRLCAPAAPAGGGEGAWCRGGCFRRSAASLPLRQAPSRNAESGVFLLLLCLLLQLAALNQISYCGKLSSCGL